MPPEPTWLPAHAQCDASTLLAPVPTASLPMKSELEISAPENSMPSPPALLARLPENVLPEIWMSCAVPST